MEELCIVIYCKKASLAKIREIKEIVERELKNVSESKFARFKVTIVHSEQLILVYSNLNCEVIRDVVSKALTTEFTFVERGGLITLLVYQ